MPNKDIIKKYNFNFSKKFGQNFIFDTNLLRSIVSDAGIDERSKVLEIGTGAGTLTREIAQVADTVDTYEIDSKLESILDEAFDGLDNIHLYFEDFMFTPMNTIEARIGGEYDVIANLPYYITTPIIFKIIEQGMCCKSLTLMVQREVADRICAKSACKDYGVLSVILQARGNVKMTRKVDRRLFTPAPNVDSAIIHIDFTKKYDIHDMKLFDRVVHAAFGMRRKTLYNNLRTSLNISPDDVLKILSSCNLREDIRGEACTVVDFVALSNAIGEYLSKK